MLTEDAIRILVSTRCNIPLALERASRAFGRAISEAELVGCVLEDSNATNDMMRQLRTMLAMDLFGTVSDMGIVLRADVAEMDPNMLARTYTGLVGAFTGLTQSTTRVSIDLDSEAMKVADELGLDKNEVLNEIKGILSSTNSRSVS